MRWGRRKAGRAGPCSGVDSIGVAAVGAIGVAAISAVTVCAVAVGPVGSVALHTVGVTAVNSIGIADRARTGHHIGEDLIVGQAFLRGFAHLALLRVWATLSGPRSGGSRFRP